MLLKIFVDRNLGNLFTIIQESKGTIYLDLENEKKINLKKYDYKRILFDEIEKKHTLSFHVYHPSDYFKLVNYHLGLNMC